MSHSGFSVSSEKCSHTCYYDHAGLQNMAWGTYLELFCYILATSSAHADHLLIENSKQIAAF